jgi:hypothetical protein
MYVYEDSLEAMECRKPYWAMVARDARRFKRRIQKSEVLLKNVLLNKISKFSKNVSVNKFKVWA